MAGQVPFYQQAPAPGFAFPQMHGWNRGPAQTRNALVPHVQFTPQQLQGMAAQASQTTGLPVGQINVQQTRRGNVYLGATHLPIQGWGGQEPVRTHFSAHAPSGQQSVAGQFHIRTNNAGTRSTARAIPTNLHSGPIGFGAMMSLPQYSQAYPSASSGFQGAAVGQQLAQAYGQARAQLPGFGMVGQQPGQAQPFTIAAQPSAAQGFGGFGAAAQPAAQGFGGFGAAAQPAAQAAPQGFGGFGAAAQPAAQAAPQGFGGFGAAAQPQRSLLGPGPGFGFGGRGRKNMAAKKKRSSRKHKKTTRRRKH